MLGVGHFRMIRLKDQVRLDFLAMVEKILQNLFSSTKALQYISIKTEKPIFIAKFIRKLKLKITSQSNNS